MEDDNVPQNFLIKLSRKDRVHYIFCDLAVSVNYSEDPAKDVEEALVDRAALERLIESRQHLIGELADIAVTLPEPGTARDIWSVKQSYPRRNQIPDVDPTG
jgi:hypothetical protein